MSSFQKHGATIFVTIVGVIFLVTILLPAELYLARWAAPGRIAISRNVNCIIDGVKHGQTPAVICRLARKYRKHHDLGEFYEAYLVKAWMETTPMSNREIKLLFPGEPSTYVNENTPDAWIEYNCFLDYCSVVRSSSGVRIESYAE